MVILRRRTLVLLLFTGTWLTAATGTAQEVSFSAERITTHVRVLASESFQGRQAGTPFERRAADYVASQLGAMSVAPLPTGNRLQRFPLSAKPNARQSLNVLGYIPPVLHQEFEGLVVLGAHIDHLGQTPDGRYFPGAEDNASGVAVVLEVARMLQRQRRSLRRGVVIVFFGAEEIGLVGSRWFVQRGPIKQDDMVAMVNVDMIGRPLVDQAQLALLKRLLHIDSMNSVGVVGTKGRPFFTRLVEDACERAKLTPFGTQAVLSPIVQNLARNRADHSSFETVGIPTLFFGAGESDDYHKQTDTPDKLQGDLMARRALVIFESVLSLAQVPRDEFPERRKPETQKSDKGTQADAPQNAN